MDIIVVEKEKGESMSGKSLKDVCSIFNFSDLGDREVIRGQHANRRSEFILINVCGSSKVRITDGTETVIITLDKPRMGVYIPTMVWKDMYDFSPDSILLVLSSEHYDGAEYIRDYEEYLKEMKNDNK